MIILTIILIFLFLLLFIVVPPLDSSPYHEKDSDSCYSKWSLPSLTGTESPMDPPLATMPFHLWNVLNWWIAKASTGHTSIYRFRRVVSRCMVNEGVIYSSHDAERTCDSAARENESRENNIGTVICFKPRQLSRVYLYAIVRLCEIQMWRWWGCCAGPLYTISSLPCNGIKVILWFVKWFIYLFPVSVIKDLQNGKKRFLSASSLSDQQVQPVFCSSDCPSPIFSSSRKYAKILPPPGLCVGHFKTWSFVCLVIKTN